MKSDKKLLEICMDIYKELYKKAQPPADIDKLIKDGTTKKENWFYKYYLPIEKIEEIIEKHCKKHRLGKYDKRKVHTEIILGASPSSNKERWEKEKEE